MMSDIAPPAVEPDRNTPAFPAFASAALCQATNFGSAACTTDRPAGNRADRAPRHWQMLPASVLEDFPLGVGVSKRHGNRVRSNQPLHDHVQRG
jgi:hypothetical protein